MKAVRIFEHGDTSVLKYGDYPMPEAGPSDLVVRVLATSVSRWDVIYRQGIWRKGAFDHKPNPGRRMFPLPMQLGRDAVGVVEAVGSAVTRFKPGDRVVCLPHPENPASPEAIRGLGNLSTGIDLPAHGTFGGNAQFVALPESYWMPLPDGVAPEDAAAAMWSYSTSHRILTDRLGTRLNDWVLVTGASGGMGSAAVDLARAMGAQIVAVTRSPKKVAYLEGMGADRVVVVADDAMEKAVAMIREATGGTGVDGVIEFTGNRALFRLSIDCLRLGGTLVPVGADWSGAPLPISDQEFTRLELSIRGIRASRLNDQRIVLDLLAKKKITPRIFAVLPLAEIARAHEMLERGEITGRIVLDPWREA